MAEGERHCRAAGIDGDAHPGLGGGERVACAGWDEGQEAIA